ncbi:IS110 family transposase [Streptomyces sviceus ATCC 29083]|uniref:IS110 family transposase n=1 Tax=Streptomyces sviceus (strain ATCC 29083 / DSM 924 / JCM 4929 / NBRC 13980 / NCIMB 11184 / NRRL 5439 / UC 5370) TaxID=463191 RepID=B5I4F8_STRX2|nr:IS110 family transposase [Streptomyces sviceus ATCC 29083]
MLRRRWAGICTVPSAEGKKHNAALICLARRRCYVLYAMLRNGTHYRHPEPAPAAAAA